MHNKIVVLDSK